MFGRKQSSFTLGNRLDAHDLDVDIPSPPPQAMPERAQTEVTPPPERRATPRPDTSSYFPPADAQANEAQVTEAEVSDAKNGALLKLGSTQSVGEGAPMPAASAAPKRRAGRAKTRLLGIDHAIPPLEDVLAGQPSQEASAPLTYHAVGWLVIMEGPGRGHSLPLRNGVSQLGRGEDQSVQLNFGDTSISRSNHASIAFDEEKRCFFIGHGGKANLVRLNGAPVLSTETVAHGDAIRIGETVLQLVAFCGADFTWSDKHEPTVTDKEETTETATDLEPKGDL